MSLMPRIRRTLSATLTWLPCRGGQYVTRTCFGLLSSLKATLRTPLIFLICFTTSSHCLALRLLSRVALNIGNMDIVILLAVKNDLSRWRLSFPGLPRLPAQPELYYHRCCRRARAGDQP